MKPPGPVRLAIGLLKDLPRCTWKVTRCGVVRAIEVPFEAPVVRVVTRLLEDKGNKGLMPSDRPTHLILQMLWPREVFRFISALAKRIYSL